MRVLVTGAAGMVGQAVSEYCESIGDVVIAYDHQSLDIADSDRVRQSLQKDKPAVVVNCAAWTDVDGCESGKERAFSANARGPENLANASQEIDARLITISTDYVFDGEKEGFYTQADEPNPKSVYGVSKLDGERLSQLADPRSIVVRTGFIFGPGGSNFLSTIVERARRGEKLKAISDAYGTPTYSRDLARRLRELAELDESGMFHVVNSGAGVSYEEFARAALDLAGFASTDLETVTTDSLRRPAPRPRNSRLACLRSEALGLRPLPFWRDSLKHYVGLSAGREVAARN